MKYVRTKDGDLGYMNASGDCYFKTWMCNNKSILKEDFKYADTIEDLCDFPRVEVISDEEGVVIYMLGMYKELPPNESIKSGIYGAILTKNGITFVAKEDNEGELELL